MDIKQWQAYRALKKVARQKGISVNQVMQDIDDVILEAYTTARKEGNQQVLAAWREIPCKGALPTSLELVSYLANQIE